MQIQKTAKRMKTMYNIEELSELGKAKKFDERQTKLINKLLRKTYNECLDFDDMFGQSTIREQDRLKNLTIGEILDAEQDKEKAEKFINFSDALCTYLYGRPAILDDEVCDGKSYVADKYYHILRDANIKLALQKKISKREFLGDVKQKSIVDILNICDKAIELHQELVLANSLLHDELSELFRERRDQIGTNDFEIYTDVIEYQIYELSQKIACMRSIILKLEHKKFRKTNYENVQMFRSFLTKKETNNHEDEPGDNE